MFEVLFVVFCAAGGIKFGKLPGALVEELVPGGMKLGIDPPAAPCMVCSI